MSKRKIIVAGTLALVSFALALGASYLFSSGPQEAAGRQSAPGGEDPTSGPPVPLSLQERDLDELVRNLRHRIADCRAQAQQLGEREKQIRIVQDHLARQAQELEDLRVKAAAALAALRQEKAAMDSERVKIEAEDRANLKKTAAIYEKMDPSAGGKILADMCAQNNEDAVVRILYYMNERSAAKTLESLTDKKLAARLCDKIKRVREMVQ